MDQDSIHCSVTFAGLFLVPCLFSFFNDSLGISLYTTQICVFWLLFYVCFLGFLCSAFFTPCGLCLSVVCGGLLWRCTGLVAPQHVGF